MNKNRKLVVSALHNTHHTRGLCHPLREDFCVCNPYRYFSNRHSTAGSISTWVLVTVAGNSDIMVMSPKALVYQLTVLLPLSLHFQ